MIRLPVDDALPALIGAVRSRGAAVLVAPPGSGKTTRVPPGLLDAGVAGGGRVVVLQPRRVAARLAARRIAEERGVPIGGEVGWRVRFEDRTGPETRIEVLTEGLLTRRLQADPFLEGVGAVVLDEFHERSLHADLALTLLAEVRREIRPELAVVVMSATLDPGPVADFLGCEVVRAEGRRFPVTLRYLPADERPAPARCAAALRRALEEHPGGHALAFLPGAGEIERTARALGGVGAEVLPLHGGLGRAAQDRALAPSTRRKVVLATNIAETSVTLEGVEVVVDSGLVRRPRYEPALGLDRLEVVRVSAASAEQRAGRAGRTGPGLCLRLWSEHEQQRLEESAPPEIARADLASLALEVRAWGAAPGELAWLTPPPAAALEEAEALLEALGALAPGPAGPRITALGRELAGLPLHPRLGAVVAAGRRAGCLEQAAWLAALASERDPFRDSGADLEQRLEWLRRGPLPSGADERAAQQVRAVARQLVSAARRSGPEGRGHGEGLRTLLAGFPDRVAAPRPGGRRLKLAGGRGAEVVGDPLPDGLYVAINLELRDRGADPGARLLAPADRAWLAAQEEVVRRFDPSLERVICRRVTRYRALVLEEAHAESDDPAADAEALLEAARAAPERALAPDDELRALTARVDFLRRWMPELALPDLSPAALVEDLCYGRRAFSELRAAALPEANRRLAGAARAALEAHAPERVQAPSGAWLRLDYSEDPPVLSARIQQLFGMAGAPALAAGRVRCRVHLLAPNNRPAQVTDDLESFWANTYPEVRRELRGRYPKHAWPERPGREHAEDRPRRRR